jgi:DNA polymerase elongation subunit (family B)
LEEISNQKTYNLMNGFYDGRSGVPILWFSGRDINREIHWFKVEGFRPYFYGADENGDVRDIFNRPVKKIYTRLPTHVRREREKYKYHDAATILFPLRYIIDRKILCGFKRAPDGNNLDPAEDLDEVPPKYGLFDIEVESPPEIMSRPEAPVYPIVTFQFSSNYFDDIIIFALDVDVTGEKVEIPSYLHARAAYKVPVTFDHPSNKEKLTLYPIVYVYDDEMIMLNDVSTWCNHQEFDAMGGYNSDTYDFPYWIERCKYLNRMAKTVLKKEKNVSKKWNLPTGKSNNHQVSLIDYYQLSKMRAVSSTRKKPREKGGQRRWSVYIKGVQCIDIYKLYQKWSGGRQPLVKGRPFGAAYDFHTVMEYECGFYYKDMGDRIKEIRKDKPYELIRYCCGDAYALRLLEEKKTVIGYFERFRRNVGTTLMAARHNSKLGEMRMRRLSEVPLPSSTWRKKSKVKGAVVLLPKRKGIIEYVVVIDIKSLYPTLMMIYNLSPEVLDRHGEIKVGPTESGKVYRFKRRPIGIIPRAVKYDSDLREKYRDMTKSMGESSPRHEFFKQLETLHKFMSCSYYGMTGYEGFMLYSDPVRESITFLGREALKEIARECRSLGYEVLYGDTDSLFIKLSGSMYREGFVVEAMVNQVLVRLSRRRGSRRELTCKFEHFCKRIIFVPKVQKKKGKIVTAKKRYAYIDENGELHITGLAPRRSTTPSAVRDRVLKWLEMVLIEGDVQGAKELIRTFWERINTFPLNEIGLPRSVKKGKYLRTTKTGEVFEARNPWKQGVEYMYSVYGKIFREDKKPLLIYMNRKKMMDALFDLDKQTSEVCITGRDKKLPEELMKFIDWSVMREKVITANFKQLFDAIDVPWNEVILKQAQPTLDGKGNVEIKVKKAKRFRVKKVNNKKRLTKTEKLAASVSIRNASLGQWTKKNWWKKDEDEVDV